MSSPHVVDVTEQNFQQMVLEESKKRPVLVDFWATWCGPCQVLGPVLEKLADEMQGGFLLAKVDTDQNQNIAAALQIQSIPTVHLFVDGRPVDGFMGAVPEAQVRELLAPHVKPPEGDAPPENDGGTEIEALLRAGRTEEARALLEARVEADADDAAARLQLARLALDAGDAEALRLQVEAIPEDAPEARAGAALLGALGLRSECTEDPSALSARIEADPDDLDARYALGCCLAVAGRHEEALESFLEVVKRNRAHREGAAHQAMLTVFGLLEPGSDLTRAYRRQLVLYL